MKTFYSILYCTIRPNQGERISIGIFFGNQNQCYFDYSNEKLYIIRDLLSPQGFGLLKSTLKSIKQLTTVCIEDTFKSHMGHASLSESYFGYLAVYANNLLTYSNPININLEVNDDVFKRLFQKFVFHLDSEEVSKPTKIEVARKRLSNSIKPFVNFDIEVTNKTIPGLVIPSKVAFIGKNDVEVAGEINDFSKASHYLKQQISSQLYFVDHLKKANRNSVFFYIGDEPPKSLKDNHDLWKTLKGLDSIDFVSTNEIAKVEEYMVTHGVTPIVNKEDQR